MSYTLSKAIGNPETRSELNCSIELPFGKDRRLLDHGGDIDKLVGVWELNGIYTAQSGIPVAIISQTNRVANYSNVVHVSGTANSNTRPNNNGISATLDGAPNTRLNQWFNTGVFNKPVAFTSGSAPPTLPHMRADGMNNLDFALFKNNGFSKEAHTTGSWAASS